MIRKGELGCPNCDGPCLGCFDDDRNYHVLCEARNHAVAQLRLARDERDRAVELLGEAYASCQVGIMRNNLTSEITAFIASVSK
jgi:hypothetical protein